MDAGAAALSGAAPRLAASVTARRIESGGQPVWVLRNPATGRFFRASPRLYMLAAALDGRTTVEAALARLPATRTAAEERTDAALLDGIARMLGAGLLLLPAARQPPAPRPGALGLLSGIAFTRFRLGDMAPAMPLLSPLLGWLYGRAGASLLAGLLLLAAVSWTGRAAEIDAQFRRLADPGLADIATAYLLFIATKLLHEAGHAVALHRMAMAEGQRTGPITWGVSFMFLLPAPYVDASAAWLIASPRRRAVVGLAGIATDLLVAALAALAWSAMGPGALGDRLFDLVLVCGASSLLFNLNPLVKLDGYFVLSDLTGLPNLQAQGQAALGRLLLGPFGLADRPRAAEAPLALHAAMSWLYRWTIYLSIFWLAGGVHWLLAGGVVALVALLFLGLPLIRLARRVPAAIGRAPGGASAFAGLLAAALAAIALVPLPDHLVAEGVVVQQGLRPVYAPSDGRVSVLAPPGPAGGAAVMRIENPETERLLLQVRAEAEALAIETRRARAAGAERVDAAIEREQAVARQIAALEAERTAWNVVAPPDAAWEPLRAELLAGAWIRRDDARPLGVLIGEGAVVIHLVLDQWDGPAALAMLAATDLPLVPVRLRGAARAGFAARPAGPAMEARDSLPSPALAMTAGGRIATRRDAQGNERPVERVFEFRLVPESADAPALRHGARVEARLPLPQASLAAQAWHRARQALQRRLAV
jgi:putative peptide zinc metalloprotease protein